MRTLITFLCCISSYALGANSSSYILTTDQAVFDLQINRKLMLVEAQVDDQKGFFILDTGAPDLILNTVHFKHLKRAKGKQAYLDVDGWRNGMQQAKVAQFRWGPLERAEFWVGSTDLAHVEKALGSPILGLIGQAVFKHYEMHIHYVAKKIVLYACPTKSNQMALQALGQADHNFQFKLDRHLPIVEAEMGQKYNLNLALDSGASINIIDFRWQQKIQSLAQRTGQIHFQGVQAHLAKAPFLAFPELLVEQRMQFFYWKAAFADLTHFAAARIHIDGLLGINFFQIGTVCINYQSQTIKVWEKQSIFSHRYTTLK